MFNHPQKQHKTKHYAFGILGIALFVFVGTKVYPIIHGPEIVLEALENGSTLSEPMIDLAGVAEHTQDLLVNGAPMALGVDGSFAGKALLSPGYNIITVAATDRYGKTETKNYALVLHENDGGTFTAITSPFSDEI